MLARRASQIGSREVTSSGNWIYGVALKTARKAKTRTTRRQALDRLARAGIVSCDNRYRDQTDDELARVLHEEINRLPKLYRAAVVACYLEGMSQSQAAQEFRVKESTVRGRLARARKLLGRRLIGRGVVPATVLPAMANSAAVGRLPPTIVQTTVQAAFFFVNRDKATSGAISATAHGIANGVLSAMVFSSFKAVAASSMALLILGAGTLLLTQPGVAARTPLGQARIESAAAITTDPQEEARNQKLDRVQGQARGVHEVDAPRIDLEPDLVKLISGPIVRTIPVTKDCMILAYLPNWNFGNVDNIGLGNNEGGVRTLVNWPSLLHEEALSSEHQFLLALYARKTISHPPVSVIHGFEILAEWPERTSWKTQPRYDVEPATTQKFEPGHGWKLFDVTALVRSRARTGRNGHGILLRFLNEDVSGAAPESFSDYKFVSREGADEWAARRPVLLVVKAANPKSSGLK